MSFLKDAVYNVCDRLLHFQGRAQVNMWIKNGDMLKTDFYNIIGVKW